MRQYKRLILDEEIEDKNNNDIPDWIDDKVDGLITELRDGNFGNADGRQHFVNLITSLFDSKDKRARLAFKKISAFFSEIGDELLTYGIDKE